MTEPKYTHDPLLRARLERGLTNREIATKAKVSEQTVSRVMRGESCRPPTMRAIARVLRVSLVDLVE